ncbi:MAG TPA: AIR synthase related protein [Dehalococcoidia bacterium]|nr:AIR synthase related protein [Dehalococcoidia bacterium]
MSLLPGKLPPEALARLLATVPAADPRVLLGPGIGRDAAVLDLGDGRVLVAKMDPVTFATDEIGRYAVAVNANDVACMGARPAWFLATALLPEGADQALAEAIFAQIVAACQEAGAELIGGHTEITVGLDRPILSGAMLGEAARDEIVTGEDIAPGDLVLMTGAVAVEGTALLARECAPVLRAAGVDAATIAAARRLLFDPGISIVRAARAIAGATRPRLMHDPTEGGIATALHELASATRMTLRIDPGAIDVLPETQAICAALALDPLGLLASGSLLVVVPAADGPRVASALTEVSGGCRVLGRVEEGEGRVIMDGEDSAPLVSFPRDELARFFEQQARSDNGPSIRKDR